MTNYPMDVAGKYMQASFDSRKKVGGVVHVDGTAIERCGGPLTAFFWREQLLSTRYVL